MGLGLSDIPGKSIILVEEDIGSVERVFLARIVFDSLRAEKRVLYLSIHNSRDDILNEMSSYSFFDSKLVDSGNMRIHEYFSNLARISEVSPGFDVCIVDPFSFLIMHKDNSYVVDFLSALKKLSRKEDIIFFLSMDHGISDSRTENIVRSLVDGIIHFREEIVGRRIERYIYVPKLKGRIPLREMISIIVTEEGISIDTRQTIR
ncbi:MAG: hypothetical protein U9M95_02645 [Candidatus Altiarchaeota archaeon]|nr:hypothetical protein [Candidatus Altiarchaeota archaeon]